MWIADRVEQLVPYLRRYARASLGDTASGDACVERVLEHVLRASLEPSFEPEQYDRERLYKLLDGEIAEVAHAPGAKARRALLLIAVEGFKDAAAGRILGVNLGELSELVESAERDFAE